MLDTVRCREWSPLATQQLRIRSLLQIVGYNIYNYENSNIPSSYYYTLHTTSMSAPIYTSEKLLSNHPKWREIDSELIHKMSSPSIIIRIWQHIHYDHDFDSAHNSDTIVQTWNVNFSGLLHIGANLTLNFTPESFKNNTLVFQMIGGYFCAYDSLKIQYCKSLNLTKQDVKKASPARQIPINKRRIKTGSLAESKSLSPGRTTKQTDKYDDKNIYSNQSPLSMTNFSVFNKNSSPKSHHGNGGFEIHEYSGSDEGIHSIKSPSASIQDIDIEESVTAENFVDDSEKIPKCRYISMEFLKSEIRPSYTKKKLKDLHSLQYSIKVKTKSVKDIKNEIYKKSAMENSGNISPLGNFLNNDNLSRSQRLSISSREGWSLIQKRKLKEDVEENSTETSSSLAIDKNDSKSLPQNKLQISDRDHVSDTRFTISFNKLLDIKTQPSPSHRLKFAQLTKAVEFGRFRKTLLQDEYDRACAALRKKKEIHAKLYEENQDMGTDLMQKIHSLSRKSEQLKELKKSEAALCALCARSSSLLYQRRWELVQDIQLIFPITEDEEGRVCILGAHLPACKNDADSLEQCGEAMLAINLGRVSHATALAATILATPLRYPLKLMGSRTKVLDHISTNDEISLFARNKNSSKFRYGLYLLNTNIAQLLWAVHKHYTANPGDTLSNLKKLLTPPTVSPSFDASKMFGSTSSMETSGTGAVFKNYGINHPGSAPTMITPAGMKDASSAPKLTHNPRSLRSLVAVGGVASRQFNRFKDSIDGQSLNNALGNKKQRYSRSVGSYAEENVLQSYEANLASVAGSEPSLMLHGSKSNTKISDLDANDSQIENKQNVLSLSESDLTKVSDILSPETSSVNEMSPKAEDKVIFSLGDDSNIADNSDPVMDEDYNKQSVRQPSIPMDNEEVDAKLENTEEKCQTSSKNDCMEDCDSSSKKLQCSDSFNSTSEESSLREDYSTNCTDVIDATNQILEDIQKLEMDKQSIDANVNKLNENAACCPLSDIEKLGYPPYCTMPCAVNCPKLGTDDRLHPGYDQCENGKEIMQDVIVLPSAEAVMTCSSHFTNMDGLTTTDAHLQVEVDANVEEQS